eukprot:scaffold6174_cov125-Isochrysis_galbana.AAC.28
MGRGRLWVMPAVIGTIQRGDGALTLHRGVAHLELRRRHYCNGTGGEDLWIGELRVEALWAAMDDGRGGGGKAIHIYVKAVN